MRARFSGFTACSRRTDRLPKCWRWLPEILTENGLMLKTVFGTVVLGCRAQFCAAGRTRRLLPLHVLRFAR